jgi:hypothetical protein
MMESLQAIVGLGIMCMDLSDLRSPKQTYQIYVNLNWTDAVLASWK